LFHIAAPDNAYFGQKDAQQTEVLKRMVDDLFFPVRLHIMPIIREADGLAKSSRNIYLNPAERKAALVLYKSLKQAQKLFLQGEKNSDVISTAVRSMIAAEPLSTIDYVEMYTLPGLITVGKILDKRTLLAVAVKFGATRLIDNTILEVDA
jgi:pantoate--beta-alanine ligase